MHVPARVDLRVAEHASHSERRTVGGGRTDASGAVIAHWPNVCLGGLNAGVNVFTVTVDDGQGHQTSDTMTVTAGSPGGDGEGTIVITAPAQGEVIPGGKPYTIRWTAPANMGGEELFVTVTTDGGAPSDHIWECTGSACRSAARSSSRITK